MKNLALASLAFLVALAAETGMAREKALDDILNTVKNRTAKGQTSVLLVDIDETLVDSRQTMFGILLSVAQEKCAAVAKANLLEACDVALGLSPKDMYRGNNGYDLDQIFTHLGFNGADPEVQQFTAEWGKKSVERILAGDFTSHRDASLPGAVGYFRQLRRAGAWIFFGTNRYEKIRVNTEELLQGYELLEAGGNNLLMKKPGEKSADAKTRFAETAAQLAKSRNSDVVALFENEPGNLQTWLKVNPKSAAVFVKGNFTPGKTDPIPAQAVQIQDYR